MKTPFSAEQFFSVFDAYNHAVFPSQIILLLLGAVAVFAVSTKHIWKDRYVAGLLGLLWLWTGIVYHISFFSDINLAAYGFGALFILQGFLFLWEGFAGKKLTFQYAGSVQGYLGFFFILYGLAVYPVVNYLVERNLAHSISLGLPCPTMILTFGFLMVSGKKFPKYLLIIPSLWALVGISAAVNFGVYQDLVMVLTAVVANVLLLTRSKRMLQ